ncbi:hypothetical protein LCGC14_0198490 [marine sediment metagenome]|uniref:DUF559 domain-containing protein n=1 Tax=marine sediment metagenome TaxID=412755 RepID=A0A0F9X3M9_9ZZZZ|nr:MULTISPECIES: hypothetical protein [unclassified Maribacter]HDZ04772.1 hypothetical protein [Maribacter sp.]HEA81362.1 hypothetical protein [Maribacter sp.]|tara:strand:- start:4143 stop:4589 length:447 start_codon:yes stop_codon:yes gene_type:complete
MICLECKKELGYLDHKNAMDSAGVELCMKHHERIELLINKHNTPLEAIQLYYALKEAGVNSMLEWWDGKKSIDIAISRVKLNIEIDSAYDKLTEHEAINNLEEAMHSFKNGFTTIRIPHIVVRYYLNETVNNIIGIMEGLKANIKVIN